MNWGPGAAAGFQNALSMGMQFGQMARQRQEQTAERNALAAYAKDPNEANFAGLADARPDIAIGERQRMQAQQEQQVEADLTRRALAGEADALTQLATLNFGKWKSIDEQQRATIRQESEMFAGAALDILKVPPGEQRRSRIVAYAQQFPQHAEKINQIAFLPPAEQELALRTVIAEAGMIGKLHEMEDPRFQRLGPDEVFVNTRDPTAVAQFTDGGQQAGGITTADIDAELARRGVR